MNIITGVAIVTRDQGIHSDQLTWQVSPRNKLAFRFQSDPLTIENFDTSSSVPPDASRTFERGGPTYGLSWIAPLSSQIIVDSLVAYQDHETAVRPSVEGEPQDCMVFDRYPALNEARCFDTTRGLNSGSFPETFEDRRQRLTVRSDATLFFRNFLGSTHQLKLGFAVENERYFRELTRRADISMERFFPIFPPPFVIGRASITVPVPTTSEARATGTSWALYAEDQIKPTANLSITLGLRFDREEIRADGKEPFDPAVEAAAFFAEYSPDLPANFINAIARRSFTAFENIGDFRRQLALSLGVQPALIQLNPVAVESSFWPRSRQAENINIINDNLSPRFAVAWDPWSNGKTKFAATWGRYYDKVFLAIPLIELEPSTTFFTVEGQPRRYWERDPIVFQSLLPPLDATINTQVVDRDLRTPFQDEFSFGFERALWPETSIKVSYLNREFRDQLQDVDINHDADGVVFNPGWGQMLLVGNFNTGEYESWVLELVRRFYRGWELNASYTWSEAVGDGEDYDQLLGNARNRADAERSFLSYDQRHIVRINAMTVAPKNIRLGGTLRWESGLPFSVLFSSPVRFLLPPEYATIGVSGSQFNYAYPTDQRNDQRNESFWTFDARMAVDFRIQRKMQLQFTAEIFNLLNDDTLIQTDTIDGNFAGVRRFGRQFQLGLRCTF